MSKEIKFSDIETGVVFNLGNTPSYPKLKTDSGYVDMRDGLVNDNPNQAVLSAEIEIMTISDLVKQFNSNKETMEDWVKELRQKYIGQGEQK
jgi:hypothetical protein